MQVIIHFMSNRLLRTLRSLFQTLDIACGSSSSEGVAGMPNATAGETRLPAGHEAFHAYVDITKQLLRFTDLSDLLDTIVQHVQSLFHYEICSVSLVTEEKDRLYIAAHRGYDQTFAENFRMRVGRDGIIGHVAHTGQSYYCPDASVDPYYLEGAFEVQSQYSVPLTADDKVIGVLDVESVRPDDFPPEVQNLLDAFGALASLAISHAQYQEHLEHMASTDGLTGLANHRTFWENLNKELSRSRRYETPLSLLMLEVDRFKRVNDSFGHLTGDEALRDIARILNECCRTMDLAARIGGDEFALILPETDKEGALRVARRVARKIDNYRLDGQHKLTVSIGLAAFPEDGYTPNALFAVADYAMYRIKDEGGDGISTETPTDSDIIL